MNPEDILQRVLGWGKKQTEANAAITKEILAKLDEINDKLDKLIAENNKK